jgi:hypothetical protein
MQFRSGRTRSVILVGKYAIKIARFRVFRQVGRLVEHSISGRVGVELRKFDSNILKAGLKYIFIGIWSNRAELYLYRKYGEKAPLAPTYYSFFGIINIQKRGQELDGDFLNLVTKNHLWTRNDSETADLRRPEQFCVIEGKIVLADYGKYDIEPIIASYA